MMFTLKIFYVILVLVISMSKYYLVASYFDGRNFYDETIIKSLEGVKLDKLNTIDLFTASHSSVELFTLIEKELHLTGKNQFSIKCLKNKDATPNYYKIILDDKNYLETILDMKEVTYQSMDKKRKSLSVRKDSKLFKNEKQTLVNILDTKDLSLFEQIYPYSNQFSFLVHRYCETDYDNIQVMNRNYQLIMDEFSNYKTFRYWYILRKKTQKKKYYIYNVPKKIEKENNHHQKEVLSIEECEQEFEQDFYQKNHLSFEEYQTIQHNLAYLDDDKEEYLDAEEFESMNNHHQRH